MITIRRLIWDDWNVAHIARHGVTKEDVDEVCQGGYLVRQTYEWRFMVIVLTHALRDRPECGRQPAVGDSGAGGRECLLCGHDATVGQKGAPDLSRGKVR